MMEWSDTGAAVRTKSLPSYNTSDRQQLERAGAVLGYLAIFFQESCFRIITTRSYHSFLHRFYENVVSTEHQVCVYLRS